jgi:hypothetical protein
MSYSKIILKVLEAKGDWVVGNSLANSETEWGFLPERACRTARQLAAKGLIERKEDLKNGKRIVFYRALQPKEYITYVAENKVVLRQPVFN